jgi:predicted naringenin-chalcone synthase
METLLLPRLLAAAQDALASWQDAGGAGAAGITDLVVGGLTAPRSAPGPDVLLADALGLSGCTRRVPLHHLGCLGGFRALSLAANIARGDPAARVLVVYGDVSSLIGASLQSPMNEADMLSVAVFSDGAAAAVVGGSAAAADGGRRSAGGPPLVRLVASRSALLRHPGGEPTSDDMWLREGGFRPDGSIVGENYVGKAVPKHLLRSLPPFVRAILLDAGLPPDSASGVALGERAMPVLCHPGGPLILETAARALRLSEWQLEHSWRVLRDRGNMSGATNLFVLHSWLRAGARGADGGHGGALARHAVGLAFGPGLAVEGVLLEVCE